LPEILAFSGLMTAKNPLTVERTIGFSGRIWTGLSAPKTLEPGRQNGGDFGQVFGAGFGAHAPMNGEVSKRVYDFT
jgi:hypothetical protein